MMAGLFFPKTAKQFYFPRAASTVDLTRLFYLFENVHPEVSLTILDNNFYFKKSASQNYLQGIEYFNLPTSISPRKYNYDRNYIFRLVDWICEEI